MLSSKPQIHNLDRSMRAMFALCNRPSGTEESVPINIDGMTFSTTDSKYFRLIFFVIYQLISSFKICGHSLQHLKQIDHIQIFTSLQTLCFVFNFYTVLVSTYLYEGEGLLWSSSTVSTITRLSCLPLSLRYKYCLANVMLNSKDCGSPIFLKGKGKYTLSNTSLMANAKRESKTMFPILTNKLIPRRLGQLFSSASIIYQDHISVLV